MIGRIIYFTFVTVLLMSNVAHAAGERFSVDGSILWFGGYKASDIYYAGGKRKDADFESARGFSIGINYNLSDNMALRADVSHFKHSAEEAETYSYKEFWFDYKATPTSGESYKTPIFIGGRFISKFTDHISAYIEGGPEITFDKTVTEYDISERISGMGLPYYDLEPIKIEDENTYYGAALGGGINVYITERIYVGGGLRMHILRNYRYYHGGATIGFSIR
jgi:hypothetical protein